MNIALMLPHLYFLPDISKDSIFAPGELYSDLVKGLAGKGHNVFSFSVHPVVYKNVKNFIGDYGYITKSMEAHHQNLVEMQSKHPIIYSRGSKMFQDSLIKQLKNLIQKEKIDLLHVFLVNNEEILNLDKQLNIPVLYTNHDPYNTRAMKKAFLKHSENKYISISLSQQQTIPQFNFVGNVYNGIDLNNYEFNNNPDDYFVYIGRIIYPKGVHRAIEAAERMKAKLRIAGKYYENFGDTYFSKLIKPHLDNKQIIYEGFIKDKKQKSDLLKNAKALLFPIDWSEPFGLVMIEALACGTPVIAFDRGSVREIIQHGVNGFVVNKKSEMVEAMKKVHEIDRRKCRESAQNFTKEKMLEGYISIYSALS